MSSATKTLALLDFFTPDRPEIGLSQMCRLVGRDKATTYRHLQSLEVAGFIEQNPRSKQYRLGPKLLQLAQTREITVPRSSGVEGPLLALANETGETSHVSVLSGKQLFKLSSVESPMHSIRVIIDIEVYPLHATSSGLCVVAFGPKELFEAACTEMAAFTQHTVTNKEALKAQIDATVASGFARTAGSFETEVHSLAAPLFDHTGEVAGAVSTASVASRFTPELEAVIKKHLVTAAREITRNWGGTPPQSIEKAWDTTLAETSGLELAK